MDIEVWLSIEKHVCYYRPRKDIQKSNEEVATMLTQSGLVNPRRAVVPDPPLRPYVSWFVEAPRESNLITDCFYFNGYKITRDGIGATSPRDYNYCVYRVVVERNLLGTLIDMLGKCVSAFHHGVN